MCGIVALCGVSNDDGLLIVNRLADYIVHRGPDSKGDAFIKYPQEPERGMGIAFAHRRLAILDVTNAGRQPMFSHSGKLCICYNGEIYNHNDLRNKYLYGKNWRSKSDTETILELWELLGPDSIPELRGIFAFTIADADTGEVHIVRDRLGIKPLYYAALPNSNALAFCSEVRPFFVSDVLCRAFSYDAVDSFLTHGSIISPLTIHPDVREFPAGCHWVVTRDKVIREKRRYWSWPQVQVEYSEEAAISDNRRLLESAIGENLLSDVPFGVFLSGGIDSTTVAMLAQNSARNNKIRTLTLDFKQEGYSEVQIANRTAAILGTEHRAIAVDSDYVTDLIEPALAAMDQPSKDGLNTYIISRVARAEGLTVVLSGLGGDEVYCGYNMHHRLPSSFRKWSNLGVAPQSFRRALSFILQQAPGYYLQKAAAILSSPLDLVSFYLIRRQHFLFHERSFLGYDDNTNHIGIPRETYKYLKSIVNESFPLHGLGSVDIHVPMSCTLLRDSDCMSMANAIELRVPLLDHRLLEANYSMQDLLRMQRGITKKILLKAIGAELPEEVTTHPKQGFVVPTKIWGRNSSLSNFMQSTLDSNNLRCFKHDRVKAVKSHLQKQPQRGADFIWMLAVLESYVQRYDLAGPV